MMHVHARIPDIKVTARIDQCTYCADMPHAGLVHPHA